MIDYWRQLSILSPTELAGNTVTLIGAGGIGSPTAMTLAKMGIPSLLIFDDDTVTSHNLPNQMYRRGDIDRPKVEALKEIAEQFSDTRIEVLQTKFDGSQKLSGIIISAVDSMDARKLIWDSVRLNIHVPLYIEARMGAEVLRIHTLRPIDITAIRWYETTLYSSEEAVTAPCTAQSIIYTVMIAAGLIASQVKKFIKGEPYPKEIVLDLMNLILMLQ